MYTQSSDFHCFPLSQHTDTNEVAQNIRNLFLEQQRLGAGVKLPPCAAEKAHSVPLLASGGLSAAAFHWLPPLLRPFLYGL